MTDNLLDNWARNAGFAVREKPTPKPIDPNAPIVATDDPEAGRWCTAALKAICDELATVTAGSRAEDTYRKAFRVGRFVAGGYLDEAHAWHALYVAAATNAHLPGHDGKPFTASEIESAIRNGLNHAKSDPLTLRLDPNRGAPDAHVIDLTEIAVNGAESHTDAVTDADAAPKPRSLRLTPASEIKMRPIKWIWQDRLALGTLTLIGGREGIGKSTTAYQLAADITRGELPGAYQGQPKGVIVAATEDSWEHTIAPRLTAAGADLTRIYRVDIVTLDGVETGLSLPKDLGELEHAVVETDTALILLDPLMSRLDAALDTHKDAEVRLALEPLVRLADTCHATVLGLIHVNKTTGSNDALTMLMGSRAFAAVARAVLFVMVDPEDETMRLLGQPKNNLGRSDLPTLSFRIDTVVVGASDEGDITSGRIGWAGETEQTIQDALANSTDDPDVKSATEEAAEWLSDYLLSKGGAEESAAVKKSGAAAGHSTNALTRARRRLRITTQNRGFPRKTLWLMPEAVTGE